MGRLREQIAAEIAGEDVTDMHPDDAAQWLANADAALKVMEEWLRNQPMRAQRKRAELRAPTLYELAEELKREREGR